MLPENPLRDLITPTIAPDLDLKERQQAQARQLRAVHAREHSRFLDFDAL